MTYRKFVKNTVKKNSHCDSLNHAVIGLCSEAGEFAGEYKKQFLYSPGSQQDRHALIAELGDVRWYLELACIKLGITIEELQKANVAKLTARIRENKAR
jgi:NTP pyrophosphatase (non-canonical NTP hydrolase)